MFCQCNDIFTHDFVIVDMMISGDILDGFFLYTQLVSVPLNLKVGVSLNSLRDVLYTLCHMDPE